MFRRISIDTYKATCWLLVVQMAPHKHTDSIWLPTCWSQSWAPYNRKDKYINDVLPDFVRLLIFLILVIILLDESFDLIPWCFVVLSSDFIDEIYFDIKEFSFFFMCADIYDNVTEWVISSSSFHHYCSAFRHTVICIYTEKNENSLVSKYISSIEPDDVIHNDETSWGQIERRKKIIVNVQKYHSHVSLHLSNLHSGDTVPPTSTQQNKRSCSKDEGDV